MDKESLKEGTLSKEHMELMQQFYKDILIVAFAKLGADKHEVEMSVEEIDNVPKGIGLALRAADGKFYFSLQRVKHGTA